MIRLPGSRNAFAIVVALALSPAFVPAQTYTILHQFSGQDGRNPAAGLSVDAVGSLYGSTYVGGSSNAGSAFKLTHRNGAYTFSPLYGFHGTDGRFPVARPVIGRDGSIFGTTSAGGAHTLGMVYNLRPSPTPPHSVLAPWHEFDIYDFVGGTQGSDPQSDLTLDAAGSFYGTAYQGGTNGLGAVYKLTHTSGGWTYSVLYSFAGLPDGQHPYSGVSIDTAGNLYGTTYEGGDHNRGTVYELSPNGGGYTETVLYSFPAGIEGEYPVAGVILDPDGNLYGATTISDRGGTAFELSPSGGGSWTYTVLWHNFNDVGTEGGPLGNLARDSAGNLYGATQAGGQCHQGQVFKLTPGVGGYTFTDLHDFFCTSGDGSGPRGNVVLDANGNIFGTTWQGGANDIGVVYEITP